MAIRMLGWGERVCMVRLKPSHTESEPRFGDVSFMSLERCELDGEISSHRYMEHAHGELISAAMDCDRE